MAGTVEQKKHVRNAVFNYELYIILDLLHCSFITILLTITGMSCLLEQGLWKILKI